jgi:hypothetical protein
VCVCVWCVCVCVCVCVCTHAKLDFGPFSSFKQALRWSRGV